MHLPRRIARGSLAVLLAASVVHVAAARPLAGVGSHGAARGPTVVSAPCPSVRGLGSAARPWPARVAARTFLHAERSSETSGREMWSVADRWLRYRMAPDGARQLREAFPRVRPTNDRWRFRLRQPRWLDARYGRIGPFLNVRLKLLAAGVQVYSCPRSVVRRLVRATWWLQVDQPDCACDPDRILDVLVVHRGESYRVFGIS